ncbi:MAG: sensor histidine kinase [Dehalococcoidia bacterium]
MTASSAAATPGRDQYAAAALLLIGEGVTAAELASRAAAVDAAAALARLTELGLIRVGAGEGAAKRYDVTPLGRRQVEAALLSQPTVVAALQELERLRSDLLSAIAHELRTPLTAVRTSVGLLLDPTLPATADVREQLLQNVAGSADRMQRFIEDFLDVVRLRAGSIRLQLRRFDGRTLAHEAAAAVMPLMSARGQTLDMRLPATPVWVYGDHRRLGQALVNLLSNAQKFSPDGTSVLLALELRGAEAAWSVTDRGPGIAPQDRERLFERFFTSGGRTPGTGLGLPIALATAQAHGGMIEVDSVVGQGSTFILWMPTQGPAEAGEL